MLQDSTKWICEQVKKSKKEEIVARTMKDDGEQRREDMQGLIKVD